MTPTYPHTDIRGDLCPLMVRACAGVSLGGSTPYIQPNEKLGASGWMMNDISMSSGNFVSCFHEEITESTWLVR